MHHRNGATGESSATPPCLCAMTRTGRPVASILRGLRKQPGTSLLLLSIMLSFSPPHPSVIHALATYAFSIFPQYPYLPEPPPNSQHVPVLRNPPRLRTFDKLRTTPPRRGVFPIPSLEGCRVSGGVGCPQPGPLRLGSGPPLQGGTYSPCLTELPSRDYTAGREAGRFDDWLRGMSEEKQEVGGYFGGRESRAKRRYSSVGYPTRVVFRNRAL